MCSMRNTKGDYIVELRCSILYNMDVDKWLQQLKEECKPLPESAVKKLCRKVKELLLE